MDLIRGLTTAQVQQLQASTFYPNLMVDLVWPGSPLYFHLGEGSLSYQSRTYAGFGPMASLSLPSEAPGIAAAEGGLTIAGIPDDLVSRLDTPSRGSAVRIYAAFMSSPMSGSLIGPPILLFQGTSGASRIRTTKLEQGELTNILELDLVTGPSARANSTIFHSDANQRSKYPADSAGRLVVLSRAKAQKLRWPE